MHLFLPSFSFYLAHSLFYFLHFFFEFFFPGLNRKIKKPLTALYNQLPRFLTLHAHSNFFEWWKNEIKKWIEFIHRGMNNLTGTMCNADAHRDVSTPDVTDSHSRTEALVGDGHSFLHTCLHTPTHIYCIFVSISIYTYTYMLKWLKAQVVCITGLARTFHTQVRAMVISKP